MLVNPLHLTSTPAAVLNSLGLRLRLGLSTDDPAGIRNTSLDYHMLLSIYDEHGKLLDRKDMGILPSNTREYIDVAEHLPESLKGKDHLVCAHRLPKEVFDEYGLEDNEIESKFEYGQFMLYRTVVEYSFSDCANGSVIYETPPRFNSVVPKTPNSTALSFSSMAVFNQAVRTCAVLLNYSVNPKYETASNFQFCISNPKGLVIHKGDIDIPPFQLGIIDFKEIIEQGGLNGCNQDDIYTLLGVSTTSALIPLYLILGYEQDFVSIEHTHPPQTYILSPRTREIKSSATKQLSEKLSAVSVGEGM